MKRNMKSQTTEYSGRLNLNFSGQISYKDYRNTLLELTYKKPIIRVFTIILGLVMFLLVVMFISGMLNDIFPLLFLVFFAIFYPFLLVRSAKKLYLQNKLFHEKLTYHLDNEKVTIISETINSTYNWCRLFKIKETRTFFLLYHDSIVANFLDKKMFSDEEIVEFCKFINSLDVKKELKKK
jgi:c-di-AMP phosphodiesterase-like protein